MSKFCFNCGNQMGDEEVFCSNCGANQKPAAQQQPLYQQPAPGPVPGPVPMGVPMGAKKKPTLIIIISAVVVVLAVVLVLVFTLGGGGYKKPIDNMFKGLENADYDKYISAFSPYLQDYYDSAIESSGQSEDDYMDSLLKSMEEEYGKNIKVTYKITDKEHITDKGDLEDYEDTYSLEDTPTDAYELDLDVLTKGKKDEINEDASLIVAKVEGEWYIITLSN